MPEARPDTARLEDRLPLLLEVPMLGSEPEAMTDARPELFIELLIEVVVLGIFYSYSTAIIAVLRFSRLWRSLGRRQRRPRVLPIRQICRGPLLEGLQSDLRLGGGPGPTSPCRFGRGCCIWRISYSLVPRPHR